MTFANPYLLLLLLAVPALLFAKSRMARDDARAGFSDVTLFSGMRKTWRLRYRWLPTLMRACALALLVVALARPQKGQAQSVLPGQGIDIVLIMDTSSSMSTVFGSGNDTRLGAAQKVLKDFIAGRKDDRVGLVVFRNDSIVLSPLTLDYKALDGLIDGANQVNLNDGTAIGLGVAESLNLLRESKARSRVAILLTDGQNNNPQLEPLAAAKIAQTLGVRLYTIGVIDPRSRSGGGNVDEKALSQMADVTGGRYFSADSPQALQNVYQSIDQLEKSRVGRLQFAAYDELAVYFLAGALAFIGLELALNATLWRRSL